MDDRISRYLDGSPEHWSGLTIRHLLTHTSGVKTYTEIGHGFELTEKLTQAQFLERLSSYPLDLPPGTKFHYSNSGFSLLGYIIENVS